MTKTRKPKRCRHGNLSTVRAYIPDVGRADTVVVKHAGTRCDDCGLLRPLGPSNDDSDAVRVEIRAAEIAACDGARMSEVEARGYGVHPFSDEHPGFNMEGAWSPPWLAGWMASEIDSRDLFDVEYDAHSWPWNPTRPVAGQYEEWERAAEIEATTPSRHLDGWTGPDGECT